MATAVPDHPFRVTARDESGTNARTGVLVTDHGIIETPCFFPVGTAGAVKTLSPAELCECGVQAILANTYHLYLRPQTEVLEKAGGLHRFMSWSRPILTDSGGYQVFSMTELKKVRREGVEFQSHLDGSFHFFTPEKVVQIQRSIGSDLMMVLDLCAPYPCSYGQAEQWNQLTVEWAEAAREAEQRLPHRYEHRQNLWGIVQGSVFPELRRASAGALVNLDFAGYAIGGLAVGEPNSSFRELVELTVELLPESKPRYLMGVGFPEDLLFGIAQGLDFFDCVLPTRNGRNGTAFTGRGKVRLRAAREKENFFPIDDTCGCHTCTNFTRAYLRHLFVAEEMLALRLVSLHNVHFYQSLMRSAREHIRGGDYRSWAETMLAELQLADSLITEKP